MFTSKSCFQKKYFFSHGKNRLKILDFYTVFLRLKFSIEKVIIIINILEKDEIF